MKTKSINLRTNLTAAKFRARMFEFFRINKFNAKYVSFFTQVVLEGDNKVHNIGRNILINVNNTQEIYSYVELTTNSFQRLLTQNKKTIPAKKINILFIETDEKAYKDFLSSTINSRDFNLNSENS
uniref:hypothetical protein n=1 Tax=Inonotus hispidus TaxID=40469 RepID=UPI0021822839|nr:hypothetical protein N4M07_mgp032 [Inonotus hispidus]UVF38020.1 hypothetical protein [Inonotus hispidus]